MKYDNLDTSSYNINDLFAHLSYTASKTIQTKSTRRQKHATSRLREVKMGWTGKFDTVSFT